MKLPQDPRERKAAIIAAAVTFGVALVVLVLLFVLTVGSDRSILAQVSTPEIQDNEEIFLEPELLVVDNPGDEEAPAVDEAAPQPPGEPDPVPEPAKETKVRQVKNEEPPKSEPVSSKPKQVSTPKESDVKTSTPKLSAEEEKRIASMQGKLKTDNNGSPTGQDSANSGSGGDGVSMKGSLNGRKMLSCPTWKLRLNRKTTVTVSITVDADGNCTAARATSTAGTANLRSQCEKMALGSKWTPKKGAKPETGTLTFTITPR
ncbi:MAG: hypothetical protein J1F07_08965 [Muribaculaceae bacterium]|nr:hypothetical protein [Muribaculaceae bacterium]